MESLVEDVLSGKIIIRLNNEFKEDLKLIFKAHNIRFGTMNDECCRVNVDSDYKYDVLISPESFYITEGYKIVDIIDFIMLYNASKVLKSE